MAAFSEDDHHWMSLALVQAEAGRGAVEPNPMVGAAVVRDGQLIASGFHARFGSAHAEASALLQAGSAARGATLYVTLEPCCHHGKTPPCTESVIASGVVRVVVAMTDPFPVVGGRGIEILRRAGIAVEVGLLEAEAKALNRPYLKRLATGRPYVLAKWAMTLDGKLAARTGDSRWISGEASRAEVHRLRGRVDGILVGIGTVLADDCLLTARPPGPRVAARVVLDAAAQLPIDSRLAATAREVPVLVVVNERATAEGLETLRGRGCQILSLTGEGRINITAVLDGLGSLGMTNLLVEGGSRTLGSFLDAGAIDEVEVFIAPILEGGSHSFTPIAGEGLSRMADALRLGEVRVDRTGSDIRVRGVMEPTW